MSALSATQIRLMISGTVCLETGRSRWSWRR